MEVRKLEILSPSTSGVAKAIMHLTNEWQWVLEARQTAVLPMIATGAPCWTGEWRKAIVPGYWSSRLSFWDTDLAKGIRSLLGVIQTHWNPKGAADILYSLCLILPSKWGVICFEKESRTLNNPLRTLEGWRQNPTSRPLYKSARTWLLLWKQSLLSAKAFFRTYVLFVWESCKLQAFGRWLFWLAEN